MTADIQPFDWHRMFLGDISLLFMLEIAFRTAVIFLWLLLLLRFSGQRSLAQLGPLELAIVIALGSAAGDPMFYPEVPLLHAMFALALVIGFQRLTAHLIVRSETVETMLQGIPLEMVRDGVLNLDNMRAANLSIEDVFEYLRSNNVRQLGQVQRAYLEQNGTFSVFQHPVDKAPAGLQVVPPWDLEPPLPVPPDSAGPLVCLGCGAQAGQCTCKDCGVTRAVVDPLEKG